MIKKILPTVVCLLLLSACRETSTDVLPCNGSFVDPRDGQVYCTTTIGGQRWLAENLRTELPDSYAPPASRPATYGRYYSFAAARQACPSGWRLPTDAEWQALEANLGLSLAEQQSTGWRGSDQGTRLKATTDWQLDNGAMQGTNAEDFRALPAGEYNPSLGPYLGMETAAHFWTATSADTSGGVWVRSLAAQKTGVERTYRSERLSFSCRCVED